MLLILVYLWSDSGGVLDSGAKFKQIQGLQVCFSQALPTGTRSSPDILVGIFSCESLLCFSFPLISLFHFSPPSLPSPASRRPPQPPSWRFLPHFPYAPPMGLVKMASGRASNPPPHGVPLRRANAPPRTYPALPSHDESGSVKVSRKKPWLKNPWRCFAVVSRWLMSDFVIFISIS